MTKPEILWPFGEASEVVLTASGAQEVDIVNNVTVVDGVSVVGTGNRTLNLVISNLLGVGAVLIVKHRATASETLIPGAGMDGEAVKGFSDKNAYAAYVYDGSKFCQVGIVNQYVHVEETPAEVELTATGDQAVSITKKVTIVDGVTNVASGDRTLNLTIAAGLAPGALMLVQTKTAATEQLIMGTGLKGPAVVGVGGKTIATSYYYDGTNFIQTSKNQLD